MQGYGANDFSLDAEERSKQIKKIGQNILAKISSGYKPEIVKIGVRMNIQPIPPIHRVTAQTSNYERRKMFGQTYERCLPHFDWRVVRK